MNLSIQRVERLLKWIRVFEAAYPLPTIEQLKSGVKLKNELLRINTGLGLLTIPISYHNYKQLHRIFAPETFNAALLQYEDYNVNKLGTSYQQSYTLGPPDFVHVVERGLSPADRVKFWNHTSTYSFVPEDGRETMYPMIWLFDDVYVSLEDRALLRELGRVTLDRKPLIRVLQESEATVHGLNTYLTEVSFSKSGIHYYFLGYKKSDNITFIDSTLGFISLLDDQDGKE